MIFGDNFKTTYACFDGVGADIFNQLPIGLVWVSGNGTILQANPAQLNLLRFAADDYLGHAFTEFVVEPKQGYRFLNLLAAGEEVHDFSMRLRCHNDTIRHVLLDAYPGCTGEQKPGVPIFVRNITDRIELEREVLLIGERERRRIAQYLHDGLDQLLMGATFLADSVQQDLAEKAMPEANQLTRILEVLNEAKSQTRILDHELDLIQRQPDGLMTALASLATRSQKLFNLRCQFNCSRPVLVADNLVAAHLFRIAQTAVSNAIQHASPENIEISLAETAGQIVLTVNDDGTVLLPRTRKNAGVGLGIMSCHAAKIIGTLTIQKNSGGGTTIVCTVQRQPDGATADLTKKTNQKKHHGQTKTATG